jgi:hypothetical protein
VNGAERLHEELGLGDGAALLVDSLTPAESDRLARLLDEARALEAADVDAGVDAMVAAIPPVVRGRVRRVLSRDGR